MTAEGLDSGWPSDVMSGRLFLAVIIAFSMTLWSHIFIFLNFPLVRTTNGTSRFVWRSWRKAFPLLSTSHIQFNTHPSSCKVTQRSTQLTSSFQAVLLSLKTLLWFMHRRQVAHWRQAHDHILTAISILSEQQNGYPTVTVPITPHLLRNLAASSAYMMLTSSPCAAI